MGKLMLSFVIFWAYIGFSQHADLVSNIPEETVTSCGATPRAGGI
jgi:hypothetical protein